MNSFYDVANRSKKGMFIIAEDRVEAASMAEKFGHVRDMMNCTISGPFKAHNESMKKLIESGQCGQIALKVDTQEWFFVKERT